MNEVKLKEKLSAKQMEKKSPGGPELLASDPGALVPVTHPTNTSEHLLCAMPGSVLKCWKAILPSVLCLPTSFPQQQALGLGELGFCHLQPEEC